MGNPAGGDLITQKDRGGPGGVRVLVLCMSHDYFSSEWSTLESGTFRFRDPTNKERRLIPLRLDESEVPDTLRQFAYVDWGLQRDGAYGKLLESIRPPPPSRNQRRRVSLPADPSNASSLWPHGRNQKRRPEPGWLHVLSGSEDQTVRVWDVARGRFVASLRGHTARVNCVAFSGDGPRALSGSGDRTMRVWDVASGRCVATLRGHTDRVKSVAFNGDGTRTDLGLGRQDGAGLGRGQRPLRGHAPGALAASTAWRSAVMETSRLLGSLDQTVRVWEMANGRCEAVLPGHTARVKSVAISGDGTRGLSGSDDKTLRAWD